MSGLGIPEILMNIMSCQGFDKSSISTVILIYLNALVIYYLYKSFVIVEIEVGGVYNIIINVKEKINAAPLNKYDSLIPFKLAIP